jgi:hypothetical protein
MAGNRCAYADDPATPHRPGWDKSFTGDYVIIQPAIPEFAQPGVGFNLCRECGQWSRWQSTDDSRDSVPMRKIANPNQRRSRPAGPNFPQVT